MRNVSAVGLPPIEIQDLVGYFRDGETPLEDWRVGTEHEKIGLYEPAGDRVPYLGERGIRRLLERIAAAEDWQPIYEGEHLIALHHDRGSITLEPGGQIELSGEPLGSIRETCVEFNAHVDLVKRVSEDLGIAWLGLGADPLHEASKIPTVPKRRYEIMRNYLPGRGSLALDMMHATATVQANFDYSDEADMASKLRASMACSPIVSAIFANSSLSGGRPNGFISRRVEIWRHTDPDRCGLLDFVFRPDFGYRDYVEWALDVPMFFVLRDHTYHDARGLSFRAFMAHGLAGERATLGDWDLHLTTVFPEVRLKRYIEVRGADAVPRALVCALPALWKGILYDAEACQASWALASDWSWEQRQAALESVGRLGLAAEVAGRPVLDCARELVQIARDGLRRMAERGESDSDEPRYLEPIEEQLALGKSPGQVVLERWKGEWNGNLERLIDYVRY